MLKQFLPKRDIFFTLFQKLVEKNHLGSENLVNLVIQSTQLLNKAVSALEHPSKAKMVIHLCDSVHELEEQADRIISTSMSSLFSLESDFKSFLKMKEIYEGFQTVFKSCKNAAIVVKSIMLEYV